MLAWVFCNWTSKLLKHIYIYIYKYYERKKGRNYISRQACFVNRFTLQGFNIYIYIYILTLSSLNPKTKFLEMLRYF